MLNIGGRHTKNKSGPVPRPLSLAIRPLAVPCPASPCRVGTVAAVFVDRRQLRQTRYGFRLALRPVKANGTSRDLQDKIPDSATANNTKPPFQP